MIHVDRYLDQPFADEIRKEMSNIKGELEFQIECISGRYFVAHNLAKEIGEREATTALIQHAESSGAIVALACKTRKIYQDGMIVLHLGNICPTGVHVVNGTIDEQITDFCYLVRWQIDWLKERPLLADSPEMRELLERNWVEISPNRALELGLVDEII